jgi:tetratricopeptide (TPR) repeat protein
MAKKIAAKLRAFALAASLFLLTVCVFLPTLKNDFVNFDDPIYVVENIHVNHGLTWAGLKWALYGTDGGLWLPLTWLSHMVDCQIYGIKPWGHHLTSVLIHGINTTLVFLWLRRMTGAMWKSFVVAAFWGLHPLRVESVAWLAERKDVLSALFWLLTLLVYTEYARNSETNLPAKRKFYALTLVFFMLGLMAKPMLVTLPFILLLLDYWPLNRLNKKEKILWLFFEKFPLVILSGIFSIATFVIQKNEKFVATFSQLSFSERIENAIVAYVRYIGKTFWPENLCVYYPYSDHWQAGIVFSAVVLLMFISSVFIWQRRQHPYLLIGWLWFIGTLIPVIGLVQVGKQAIADRYTYIPQIGLLFCIVWGVSALTAKWKWQRHGLSLMSIMAIAICVELTCRQIDFWKNSETLFRHAIAVTEKNALAYNNLGGALLANGQIDEAIENFQKALQVNPNYTEAHYNLGDAFLRRGQIDEAIQQFQKALQIDPKHAKSHADLGIALYQLGRIEEAIEQYRAALEIDPDNTKTHNDFGLALEQAGRMDEAIAQFQKALAIDPQNAEAHFNLGNIFVQTGQFEKAIAYYKRALEINPNDAEAYNNLGLAFYQSGQRGKAMASAQRALQLANEQNNVNLTKIISKQLNSYQVNSGIQNGSLTNTLISQP